MREIAAYSMPLSGEIAGKNLSLLARDTRYSAYGEKRLQEWAFLIADKNQQEFFQKIANNFLAGRSEKTNAQIFAFIRQNQDLNRADMREILMANILLLPPNQHVRFEDFLDQCLDRLEEEGIVRTHKTPSFAGQLSATAASIANSIAFGANAVWQRFPSLNLPGAEAAPLKQNEPVKTVFILDSSLANERIKAALKHAQKYGKVLNITDAGAEVASKIKSKKIAEDATICINLHGKVHEKKHRLSLTGGVKVYTQDLVHILSKSLPANYRGVVYLESCHSGAAVADIAVNAAKYLPANAILITSTDQKYSQDAGESERRIEYSVRTQNDGLNILGPDTINIVSNRGNLHCMIPKPKHPMTSAKMLKGYIEEKLKKCGIPAAKNAAKNLKISDQDFKNYQISAFLMRAGRGDIAFVRECLEKQIVQPNDTLNGDTAMHMAAYGGKHEVVDFLVEHGADVNVANGKGVTALVYAAHNGHARVIEQLLKHPKIDVNHAQNDGATALIHAAQEGHKEAVDKLLAYYPNDVNHATNDGETALILAAQRGHKEVVDRLLAHPKIDVNLARKEDGVTALFIAAQNGNKEVVDRLLAHPKIDVNLANRNGATVLFIAAQNRHHEVIDSLLAHPKTDVNLARKDGVNALSFAVPNGHKEVLDKLLAHPKIEVNLAQKDGATALILAVNRDDYALAQLLKHPKIDVNLARKEDGVTALIFAVQEGLQSKKTDKVKLLLDHGADPYKRTVSGHDAFAYCKKDSAMTAFIKKHMRKKPSHAEKVLEQRQTSALHHEL